MVMGAAVSCQPVRHRIPGLERFCGSSFENRLYDMVLCEPTPDLKFIPTKIVAGAP